MSGWGSGPGRETTRAGRALVLPRGRFCLMVSRPVRNRDQGERSGRRFASRRYPHRAVLCRARTAGVPASSRRRWPVIPSAGATCCYSSCGRWSRLHREWLSAASGTNARVAYWHRHLAVPGPVVAAPGWVSAAPTAAGNSDVPPVSSSSPEKDRRDQKRLNPTTSANSPFGVSGRCTGNRPRPSRGRRCRAGGSA